MRVNASNLYSQYFVNRAIAFSYKNNRTHRYVLRPQHFVNRAIARPDLERISNAFSNERSRSLTQTIAFSHPNDRTTRSVLRLQCFVVNSAIAFSDESDRATRSRSLPKEKDIRKSLNAAA